MKMVKLLLLSGLILLAARSKALVDVAAFGGYSTLNMGEVNDVLAAAAGAGATSTPMGAGFYAGAQVGITLMPFLKIGPRLEYLQAGQGTIKSAFGNYTLDASLMSYELGISADFSLPLSGLSVEAGLWGGYGMANMKLSSDTIATASTGSGSGAVVFAGAQLRYKLVAGLFLGLDLGYRMATMENVNTDKTDSNWGSAAGTPFLKKAYSPTAQARVDYGGVNAGATIGWNF